MTLAEQNAISVALDGWLDVYGKHLGFAAKQALIPIRDSLFVFPWDLAAERLRQTDAT